MISIRHLLILGFLTSILAVKFEVIGEDRSIQVNMMPNDVKGASITFNTDKSFAFNKNNSKIASVVDDSFTWEVPALITHFKAAGKITHRSTVKGQTINISAWRLLELDNFSDDKKHGWQGADTEVRSCGPAKDKSLFRLCRSKTEYVEKTFKDLDPHSEIMVEMMVHFIDQWEGELAYLQIENDIVWTKSHNWCHTIFNHRCVLNGVNVCDNAYPDLVGQSARFVYKHSKSTLKVKFGTSLAQGNCKATWGINNFMLYLR